MASRLLSSPGIRDLIAFKGELRRAARKLPVAGWGLPLRNFYEIVGQLIQAAEDVADAVVSLSRLACEIRTLQNHIELYSHTPMGPVNGTDPFGSMIKGLTKLLGNTIEEINGLKGRNSISNWLSRGEIAKAIERTHNEMRIKMYSLPLLVAVSQRGWRSDELPLVHPDDIEFLPSHVKGTILANYRGKVRMVRSYATEGRQRMESYIRSLCNSCNPHVPQVIGVCGRNWSMPMLVFDTSPSRQSISGIAHDRYMKQDLVGLCAIATRGILDIKDAVKFLQDMEFLRTPRLLRCALKPGSVVVTSNGRLVFSGDVGERCEDIAWPPNNLSREEFEFHRLLVDFCVNVKSDTIPTIFGEEIAYPTARPAPSTLRRLPSIVDNTLDNLAFDATHNYAAWMSKVDQARLQATKRLVPETEHRQDFQQYCDGFLSLPRNYETMCIYLDSNTHWSAGDVVHFPTSSDGQYHSITKLCNIGDLYRWEDSPSDTPDITGAYSLSGLMEMEVSGLDGSRWTRYSFEDAEEVTYECNLKGQSYLLSRIIGNGELWPEFGAELPSLSRQFNVPVDELALVAEVGRDYVFGTYKAPPPAFDDPPAKTIYFFVPREANCEPFWSCGPLPWSDVAATIENTRSERRSNVLSIYALSPIRPEAETVNDNTSHAVRAPSEFCDDSCTAHGCQCGCSSIVTARL